MSTSVITSADETARSSVPTGSSLRAAIVSEWTKLRSVRSTMWSLAATLLFTVGLGCLFCYAYVHRPDDRPGRLGTN
ncbi:MAG TPA: hypothetical protein VGM78_15790, partial [Ilumatobacteraceae bacterium]